MLKNLNGVRLLNGIKFKKSKKLIAVAYIGAITVAGFALLFISQAASFSIGIQPENGNRSGGGQIVSDASASGGSAFQFGTTLNNGACGKRVSPYNYQVPFGNAVWNQPVCSLPRSAKSADFAVRFAKWSNGNNQSAVGRVVASPGFPDPTNILDPLAGLFSREVYLASDSTYSAKISSTQYESNLDGVGYNENPGLPSPGKLSHHPDTTIPWNPSWDTGHGGDNEIFVLEDRPGPDQGRVYTVWIYRAGACAGDAVFWPDRVCGASINVNRDVNGNIIDYRTFEGAVKERGVGLSYYATLVTPEEVQAGEIRHAIGVTIPNTAFGPECTKQQFGTTSENNTCGTAFAPASKFEWGNITKETNTRSEPFKSYGNDKNIPEGTRFALDITDAQIDSWVASNWTLKDNSTRASSAKIFAKALRDYGMIVVDTGAGQPGLQMVGGVNPKNAAKWKDLGMGPEYGPQFLLEGLINQNNLYVVEQPNLTCKDGSTSKYYCDWVSAKY